MPLTYEQEFTVFQYECDPWDRMLPGAILRRVQEIGTKQSEMLGLNEEMYRRTHTVFLLSRISLEISRSPMIEEKITLQTRAYGMKRAVYHRVTSLHGENGEKLAEADSRWVLVDTNSRRILRALPEGFADIYNEEPAEEHDMSMPRPSLPLTSFGQKRATCTMCDRNGHINNSKYADIMVDHLPIAKLAAKPVKKAVLIYRSEIELNHQFSFSGCQLEEEKYYFLAEEEGKKSFEGYVTL